jgi:hypothetical protein
MNYKQINNEQMNSVVNTMYKAIEGLNKLRTTPSPTHTITFKGAQIECSYEAHDKDLWVTGIFIGGEDVSELLGDQQLEIEQEVYKSLND